MATLRMPVAIRGGAASLCSPPARMRSAPFVRRSSGVASTFPRAPRVLAAAASTPAPTVTSSGSTRVDGRIAEFTASVKASTELEAISAAQMGAFLQVPMSRRCLMEAETVDLVEGTDDTFRCCIKTIDFFGKTLMPVTTMQAEVDTAASRAVVTARKAEMLIVKDGVPKPQEEKERSGFKSTSTNVVTWVDVDGGRLALESDVTLTITLDLPKWWIIPAGLTAKAGKAVLQGGLTRDVPSLLGRIEDAYRASD